MMLTYPIVDVKFYTKQFYWKGKEVSISYAFHLNGNCAYIFFHNLTMSDVFPDQLLDFADFLRNVHDGITEAKRDLFNG